MLPLLLLLLLLLLLCPADMPDMFAGGFNPAMLSQMDPASLAQLQKMAAQVRIA
jgi:hypothetical protein